MKVLLDECLPRPLRHDLTGHDVRTVQQMGWAGTKNGALLQRVASAFDVFITVDRNLEYQQTLTEQGFGTVILFARSTTIEELRLLMARVLEALATIQAGEVVRIEGVDGGIRINGNTTP